MSVNANENFDQPMDPAKVKAMMDEHARLKALLKAAIAAMPQSDEDYCIGMGVDEVPVRAESAEAVMAIIDAGEAAGGTVVLDFVSAKPLVFVL